LRAGTTGIALGAEHRALESGRVTRLLVRGAGRELRADGGRRRGALRPALRAAANRTGSADLSVCRTAEECAVTVRVSAALGEDLRADDPRRGRTLRLAVRLTLSAEERAESRAGL